MPPAPETEIPAPLVAELAARGHRVASVEAMAGDVSRRRYFRLSLATGGLRVLAVYPDDLGDACRRSLESGRLLGSRGVRVAEVVDHDCAAGWVLLEDLGERTLYEHGDRSWSELAPWFEDAVRSIALIATLPADVVSRLNPPLDRALLRRELEQTREVFLEPLGLAAGDLGRELGATLDRLCDALGAEAPVPCHRDLGARNLIPLEPAAGARAVAVLDHQDLRLGPPAYDLASLLNDSLFPPAELEERLLALAGAADPTGRARYHRAAAQRTLKAIGSYAAFARRGSDRHLRLVPPTLARALVHLAATPETAPLAPRLEAHWEAVLAGQGLERLRGV